MHGLSDKRNLIAQITKSEAGCESKRERHNAVWRNKFGQNTVNTKQESWARCLMLPEKESNLEAS